MPNILENDAVSESEPKSRDTTLTLLETAERLFGEFGIDGVSLRRIIAEAAVGNNAAIHYHFGTREKLVRAIWKYRVPLIDQKCRQLAAAYGTDIDSISLNPLISLLIQPSYDVIDDLGRHSYVSFFRHALRSRLMRTAALEILNLAPFNRVLLDRLCSFASVPRAATLDRIRFASCTFYDMVVERDKDIEGGEIVVPEEQFLADAMKMIKVMVLRD